VGPSLGTLLSVAAVSGDFDTVNFPAGWHYPVNPASVTVQNF